MEKEMKMREMGGEVRGPSENSLDTSSGGSIFANFESQLLTGNGSGSPTAAQVGAALGNEAKPAL